MKILKAFYLLFALVYFSSVYSDDAVSNNCEQSIKSIIAIGNQLKHNPQFKKEDLDNIINGLTQNQKIREFLRLEIVPRLMNPNNNVLNDFISNRENMARCSATSN